MDIRRIIQEHAQDKNCVKILLKRCFFRLNDNVVGLFQENHVIEANFLGLEPKFLQNNASDGQNHANYAF